MSINVGAPGQRSYRQENESTELWLVVKQAVVLCFAGWFGLFMTMCLVVLVSGADGSIISWLEVWWRWLLVPYVVWAIAVSVLIGFRIAAEISDPSYPAPRAATKSRIRPVWPWTPEPREDVQEMDTQSEMPRPEYKIAAKVEEEHKTIYASINVSDAKALNRYAKAITSGVIKPSFSFRGASSAGVGREDFEKLQALFIERGFAVKGEKKNSPVALTKKGIAVMKAIAATPPPG